MMSMLRTTHFTLTASLLLIAAGQAHAQFSARDVYRNASPSVVAIFGFDKSGSGGAGTGSIISADGKILTNNHVIFDANRKAPYENIRVFFKPDHVSGDPDVDLREPYKVKVLARDETIDLAVLQVINPPRNLAVIGLSNSEEMEVGSSVAAIGHPQHGGLWTLTTGTISSTRKDGGRDVFQTDTAINPGNSGGPLLNENSHLIGVNTFVRRVNAQGLPLEGLNYSVRSSMARDWLSSRGVRVAFARAPLPEREPTPAPVAPRVAPAPRDVPMPAPEAATPQYAAPPPPAPPQSTQPAALSEPPAPTPRAAPRPRPHVSIDPEDGLRSTPRVSPGPTPTPATPWQDPPSSGDGPREFVGPEGELMYGVPAPTFSLDATRKKVYQSAVKNAQKAFDELDDW